jgi:pilus assembly protein CpaF
MDNAGDTLNQRRTPSHIAPLSQADLAMINRVREELVFLSIKPPSWRDTDPAKRRRFFDEVRAVLMDLGGNTANINRDAQIVTDALSGVGLLDQLLRDPFVEEIFVRKGEVAVEYDGAFHYLGKLAARGPTGRLDRSTRWGAFHRHCPPVIH